MKGMLLSNEAVIAITLPLSMFKFRRKTAMDSKLASALSTLSSNISSLQSALTSFISANSNPPVSATELTSVLSSLDAANSSIAAAIATLTPASIAVADASPASAVGFGTVSSPPAPPSSQ